jgi:UDP-N-acetylglucosamine--N-acetylmuramyl-(pentapeptide) pyrophosphoryl-undecaprenol N-acetylglucosamine transferase
MMRMGPRILFAGGGTGGHVYPAIAIADAVRRLVPTAAVEFAGTQDRMEWEAVPKAGYAIHPVTVTGFQRSLSPRNLAFPFKLMRGLWQSISLVRAFDPDVVVGTGGFVSGPVLFAAALLKRPVLIQEQNAYAGVTNKLLARRAARIHVAFPEAAAYFPAGRSVLSGNPTRADLLEATREEGRRHFEIPEDAAVILVFGGSLGSQALNEAMEASINELLADENTHVIWQSGARYYDRLKAKVPEHGRLRLLKYVDRMDLAYAAADVALCRAGAITCSELMVTGTPAILVPSPNVAEDHQTKNAGSMAGAGAAKVLPESALRERLVTEARALLADETERRRMSAAARDLARPGAAEDIARDVLELGGWQGST